MKYKNCKNPKWGNKEKTVIDLTVEFDHLGEVSFTASATDVEDHGKEIHKKALAGEFGEIADYDKKD